MPTIAESLLQDIVEETAATSWDRYPDVAGSSLQRIFQSSVVMFVSEDAEVARRRTFSVVGENVPTWRPAVLGEVVSEHPMIQSYGVGASLTPRRMSDLLPQRDFERTRTYQQLFRPAGTRYQMTILTRNTAGRRGRSWVLNRDDRDFSDSELDIARRLQDLLVLLDNAAQILTAPSAAGAWPSPAAHPTLLGPTSLVPCGQGTPAGHNSMPSSRPSPDQHGLTNRELQILSLLAKGLTAAAIGRVLGISPLTVRKHLEHAYAKLGSRDRLLAVRRAAALGLLEH